MGKKEWNPDRERAERFRTQFYLLDLWLELKENGRTLEPYFTAHGYRRIGIYGLGRLGKHLLEDLRDSSVKAVYGIDRKIKASFELDAVFGPEETLPPADAVIVTVVTEYEEIRESLKAGDIPVISLEEVLFYCV